MKFTELKPSPHLQPWISRYWSWQDEIQLPPLLPGCGAELFFFWRQKIKISDKKQHVSGYQHSAILLPRNNLFHFHSEVPVSFIAVRFRVSALRHFCPQNEVDMADTFLHPTDIWGKSILQLEDQLSETQNLTGQVKIIENFLTKKLKRYHRDNHPWLDAAAKMMYYKHKTASQQDFVALSGFGRRYFQKVFRQHFGITPCHLHRIIRVEQLTRHLLLNCQRDYLDSALDYGYYDQSHFIKDFRHFIGTTPSIFFQEHNFCSHFYNLPVVP
ncbi:AraC family transcriptional regulator [Yersinia intermedia]|uniref:AraC family transcriptional regulator n=1 Tax=Yersinia intermedia TaxID=631 RepID=UPI000B6D712B|nr:helix-turn-helix domain-containing protein [Yersinia intermedia]MCW8114174.1 helix-turn-helix domain-containing protein [Yersinia intermedia]MDA5518952.1 helix-turn-helix domain-containing protein [Yersinia intermedia]OWF90375.1 hypothetical protein B4916_16170 [Yersinia intermedia]